MRTENGGLESHFFRRPGRGKNIFAPTAKRFLGGRVRAGRPVERRSVALALGDGEFLGPKRLGGSGKGRPEWGFRRRLGDGPAKRLHPTERKDTAQRVAIRETG